jgi:shikimate kinase/3-dehydroquinate synthase
LENNVTKSTLVKIFGGGALTDLASFASSTFKRGIPYELYPTSLLSQIDASIGGKTAIDYRGIKNLIGTFSVPEHIYIDPLLLITLPYEEYVNGLSEALKISMLTGESLDLFKEIDNFNNIMFFKNLILSSVRSKLKIVSMDPYDSGLRMSLNFGHTFGHVFESVTGYSHGISVLWGMEKELHFLLKLGLIDKHFFTIAREYLSILENFTGENLFDCKLPNTALSFLTDDKKSSGNFIRMPVLRNFGDFSIETFPLKEVKEYFLKEIIR